MTGPAMHHLDLELGSLDILVANAGIWKGAAIEKMTDRQLSEMLDINVKGVFSCCRKAVPLMRKSGGGRIILVASTAGQRGEAFHSHYAASKGAVISLTKSLAPELAADNILVNCIAPGMVYTPMVSTRGMSDTLREARRLGAPLQTEGTGWDIGEAVVFLASDAARWITGVVLPVVAGATAGLGMVPVPASSASAT